MPEVYIGKKIILHKSTVQKKNHTRTVGLVLDKTTWENVFINAHYLTQQNYFQINGFA